MVHVHQMHSVKSQLYNLSYGLKEVHKQIILMNMNHRLLLMTGDISQIVLFDLLWVHSFRHINMVHYNDCFWKTGIILSLNLNIIIKYCMYICMFATMYICVFILHWLNLEINVWPYPIRTLLLIRIPYFTWM